MATNRTCLKCKINKPISEFLPTKSPFHPGGYTICCMDCLERTIDSSDLAQVDKLCQWIDWPFLPNEWTKLYRSGKDRTLHLYAKLMAEKPQYKNLDWSSTNEKWANAMRAGTMDDNIEAISEGWLEEMRRKWPADTDRTVEDYHYLENFYNDLISTQNITSATQRDDAKRLVEVGLAATKKIRQGLPAKDEMAELQIWPCKIL